MNIPEPAVKTVQTEDLPSKAKLRKQIEDGFKGRKKKISTKLPPAKASGRLIGFYSVRRHEPAGIYKDAKTGETYLTGDTTPVQVIGAVRSKRSGAWAHGKKR
tara:strand:+ start:187 stop:495 length:309 start_codon:yes stop_codon:yes gene_type:complete